jgi:ABC-type nitrate/sulfonate/bicarbonate transport system substrate-binding protein
MRLSQRAIVIVFLMMGLFACSRTEQKPAGPPEKVTIAISATTDSVLAQIAQAKGYYREEGMDATVHLQPYGKLCLQEVLEGKADFATVAETPVMFEVMKGAKISIIAAIESSQRGNAIIARKDRGIHTLSDLKGKKVAVTKGTTTDYFLDTILAVNGVSRAEVKTVDMKAEDATSALVNGDIDAVSTFNTYAYPAQKKLGERGITFEDKNIYTFTFNVVATQEFIQNNPGKVKKMLRALLRAEEFVQQNPAQAQKVVAGFSGVEIAVLREIWDVTSFRVSLDQALILALEDESSWAIKHKLTGATKLPNYLDYIYLDGLKAVKPDAVRILR